jgi:hypothetical protein
MNRKQTTILIVAGTLLVVGIIFLVLYKAESPILQKIGLFPGEGQFVPPGENGENGEETNIPIFVPGEGEEGDYTRLYELHKAPVAGVGFFEVKGVATKISKAKTSSIVSPRILSARYIERGLGHIYETSLATFIESRIVNETRPRITEAFFNNNSKSVAIRYIEEEYGSEMIESRILALGTATSSSGFYKTEEIVLPNSIPFMAAAEDGTDKFFYLNSSSDATSGTLITSKGVKTGIFSSAFTEWVPQFPHQNLVTLTTRPSGNVPGYLFFLDTTTKALTRILDGVNGLTTNTSRNGKLVAYTETKERVPELFVYDVAKKESRGLFKQTLPEKCAWSTKEVNIIYCAVPQKIAPAIYPDQWYRGTISFTDSLWKIDTTTAFAEKILTPSDYRVSELDIINPVLSSDDSYILFINKKTGTPWIYRIVEKSPFETTTATSSVKTSMQ